MRIPLFKKKPERVPTGQINSDLLKPPHDPLMTERLESVYNGRLPLFHAEIPLSKIKLYDTSFRPDETELGAKVLSRIVEEVRMASVQDALDQMARPFLYVEGDQYISSDDYLFIMAYRQLGLTRVPCFVLGEPTVEGTSNIQGPATLDAAKRLVTGG